MRDRRHMSMMTSEPLIPVRADSSKTPWLILTVIAAILFGSMPILAGPATTRTARKRSPDLAASRRHHTGAAEHHHRSRQYPEEEPHP